MGLCVCLCVCVKRSVHTFMYGASIFVLLFGCVGEVSSMFSHLCIIGQSVVESG